MNHEQLKAFCAGGKEMKQPAYASGRKKALGAEKEAGIAWSS